MERMKNWFPWGFQLSAIKTSVYVSMTDPLSQINAHFSEEPLFAIVSILIEHLRNQINLLHCRNDNHVKMNIQRLCILHTYFCHWIDSRLLLSWPFDQSTGYMTDGFQNVLSQRTKRRLRNGKLHIIWFWCLTFFCICIKQDTTMVVCYIYIQLLQNILVMTLKTKISESRV